VTKNRRKYVDEPKKLCSVGLFIFHQKQCPSAVVVFATIGSTSQMEYKDMLYEIHEINMV
jgi:hypothetical protein